jgi:hypothetical protein
MKRLPFIALLLAAFLPTIARAAEPAAGCYELRIYHAAEGKLDALHARFRDHTTKLFARHGMTNVAYWVPVENAGQRLIYLLAYPDAAAREASWKAFGADPDWIAAKQASETSGELVARIESRLLAPTDFSPEFAQSPAGGIFEMRTYTTTPGNLPRLLDRFRNHTVGLFSKHGMRHFGYFTPLPGQPEADATLVYFLRHDSPEACAASAFRADPVWVKAKSASEAAAGESLTVPDGVKSELMSATDYSPVR